MSEARLLVLGALGAVLVTNHVLVRTEVARRYPALFWGLAAADALLAVLVLLFGVPGYPQGMIRLLVGLVLGMHLAQNLQARLRWQSEDRDAEIEAEYRQHLAALRDAPGPEAEPPA